jgi:hypothetical protein
MFRSAFAAPLTGAFLACLTACTESPIESTGKDSAALPTAAALAPAAITWYLKCDGCIMPSFEWSPAQGVLGWTYSYKHPVTPSWPIKQWSNDQYNGRTIYRPPEMGLLVDMDASVGKLYYLTSYKQICLLNRFPASWGLLQPAPPKGARRIGVNAVGNVAVITDQAFPGGYGIQVFKNGAWVDNSGVGVDLDFDSNGDLWTVKDDGSVWRQPANQSGWEYKGASNGQRISAGGGKVAVITKVYAGSGNLLKRWAGGTSWQDIPGQLDHLNVDAQGRIWGSSNKSESFYAALP